MDIASQSKKEEDKESNELIKNDPSVESNESEATSQNDADAPQHDEQTTKDQPLDNISEGEEEESEESEEESEEEFDRDEAIEHYKVSTV